MTLSNFHATIFDPPATVQSDADFADCVTALHHHQTSVLNSSTPYSFAKQNMGTEWHPIGTASMLPQALGGKWPRCLVSLAARATLRSCRINYRGCEPDHADCVRNFEPARRRCVCYAHPGQRALVEHVVRHCGKGRGLDQGRAVINVYAVLGWRS